MTRPVGPAAEGVGWDGRIDVDPDELEAAAPGFLGASAEVVTAANWVSQSAGSSIGISDPATVVAWNRAVQVWAHDLGDLVAMLAQVAALLGASGRGYRQTDAESAGTYEAAS